MTNRKLLKLFGVSGPFGLRVPRGRKDMPARRSLAVSGPDALEISKDWLKGFRPGYKAQTMGSCVGRGSANVAETLLMMHNPLALEAGEQIDGDRLYLWIRDRFYHDQDPNGGAQIEQGARALVETGILPPDSVPEPVPVMQMDIEGALQNGPIIQGHMVDAKWSTPAADGMIDARVGSYLGGHCTVLLGQWFFEGREAEYPSGNSWGDTYGWHGEFRMGWARFRQTCVDLWRVKVNPVSMAAWNGHRAWVKTGSRLAARGAPNGRGDARG